MIIIKIGGTIDHNSARGLMSILEDLAIHIGLKDEKGQKWLPSLRRGWFISRDIERRMSFRMDNGDSTADLSELVAYMVHHGIGFDIWDMQINRRTVFSGEGRPFTYVVNSRGEQLVSEVDVLKGIELFEQGSAGTGLDHLRSLVISRSFHQLEAFNVTDKDVA